MKKKIRNSYYIIKDVLTKEYLFYLILLIFGINSYVIIGNDVVNDLPLKLVKTLRDNYYILVLLSIIVFYALLILNKYKNRAELITRYKNKKEFFSFIIKKILLVSSFIYIISTIILFIFINFKFYFVYPNTLYYYYNISSYTYIIWGVIRNYIYMMFVTYLISYIYFSFENKNYSYILYMIIVYILLLYSIKADRISLVFIDFIYRSYGTFVNEICMFLINYIIKFYLVYFIVEIVKKIKITNFLSNNKYYNIIRRYFYKIIYNITQSYIPLLLYIIINIIFIYYIGFNEYDYKLILVFKDLKEVSFILIATKIISLLSFILFCMKLYSLDVSKNNCLIFTRISKRRWFINKLILTTLLLILFRLPLYYLTGFNINCIKDFIVYLIISVMSIYYLLNESNENIVILLISIVIFIFGIMDNIINIILLGVLLIIMIIINKFSRS